MSVLSLAPLPTLVFVSIAAVVVTGCDASISFGGDTTRRVETETVPADGVTMIDVRTDNGRVDVVGSTSTDPGGTDEVEIEIIMHEADPGDAGYSIDVVDGVIQVDGECDAAWHDPCSVGFVVTVPHDRSVDVRTDNGMITVRDLAGGIDVRTDNGAVVGTGLESGRVGASTDNGRIELSFDRVPDLVDVETDNGAIVIAVPDADYAVEAVSDNGSVDIDVPRDDAADHVITASSDNGSVHVDTRP